MSQTSCYYSYRFDEEDVRLDVEVILRAIRTKASLIQKKDNDILDILEEDKFDEDIQEATDFGLKLTKNIAIIEKYLEKNRHKDIKLKEAAARDTTGVKLPKIHIKKFFGDPTSWQQFYETYEATVHKNEKISDIEKFSYFLKGYLTGAAEKCVEGLSLFTVIINRR